jgi:hypothetical protein
VTSPTSVGEVSVDVIGDASDLAKKIRRDFDRGLADLGKKIRESVGKDPISLPVTPDIDPSAIPEKVKKTRVPKVPVEVDPLFDAFRAELRRQTTALAKQVNLQIPVDADTAGLRADLGSQLAAVARQLKVKIPAEADDKAKLQTELRAQVAEISQRIKAHIGVDADTSDISAQVRETRVPDVRVKVKADVDKSGFSSVSGLFSGLIPDIGGVASAIRSLSEGVGGFVSSIAPAGSALSTIGAALGPLGAVASAVAGISIALGGLAAAATVAGPALLAAAGAAASIPAALSGIGALVGTLKLGFKGIAEAFKPVTGGGGGGAGGSAANQARQVAAASRAVEAAKRGITAANRGLENAERTLTQAQNQETVSQQRLRQAHIALAQARKDAVDDIDDLNRALRSSKLSEEEAAQAIHDAALALDEAKLTGDIPSINRARQAYERAQITLEDTADASEDLQKQVDKTNKLGVDGTDRVQKALQDQVSATEDLRRAQEGVRDAQNGILSAQDGLASATDSLKSAQEGLAAAQQKVASGAGGIGKQVIKLAPAAQRFVDAVKRLQPAFDSLRLDVQEKLFQGLDKTVTNLGQAWIPALKTTLGSYATTFNLFFKNLGAGITTPAFITNLQTGAEGFRQGLAKIGDAVTSSLVPAFGLLAKRAAPFLSSVGTVIADLVRDFGTWIGQAEKSGALKDFFARAAAAFTSITTTGKIVTKIIGDVFNIITGADPGGKSALDSFNDGLNKVHEFLSDPKNVKQLKQFVSDLKTGLRDFAKATKKVADFFDKLGGDSKSGDVGEKIGNALVAGLIVGLKEAFLYNLKNFLPYLFGPLGLLVAPIKELLGIHSPSTVFAEIGKNIILGLLGGITGAVGQISNIGATVKAKLTTGFSTANTWIAGAGAQAGQGFNNLLRTALGQAPAAVGGVRGNLLRALGGSGSWLYGSGQAVGIGLVRGIESTGASLGARVAIFAKNAIANAINRSLGIHSPSRVAFQSGVFVGEGLALGIEDQAARVRTAADQIAAAAVPQVDATFGLGSDMDAAITRNLSVASQAQLQAKWAPGASGDKVLDAFRELISFSFNGDPVAAFGS